MLAVIISGGLTAVAGGLFAVQKSSVEPFSSIALSWSITIIVSGVGTIWGPPLRAIAIYYGITVQLESRPASAAAARQADHDPNVGGST